MESRSEKMKRLWADPEYREKMQRSQKNKKPFSEEHKKNLSNALSGKSKTESHKKNITNAKIGKKLSQEHKNSISKTLKEKWKDKNFYDKMKKSMIWNNSDVRWQKGRSSKAEIEIINILTKNKIQVEKQKHIEKYFVDIFVPNKNIIVEYNGDYWHANPNVYDKNHLITKNKKKIKAKEIWKYDKEKKQLLESMGFNVIVIWEKDYRKNKETIINGLLELLS